MILLGCGVRIILLIVAIQIIINIVNAAIPVHSNASCIGNISNTEFEALYDLFMATNGIAWVWDKHKPDDTKWSFPSDNSAPCTNGWQGLNCTDSFVTSHACNISSILLANREMYGPLPPSIGNLTSLLHVFLNNNYLSGPIPSQLSALSMVKNMFLYDNLFTGTIPSSLGLLTQIEILEMYQNSLTGTLPSELGSLESVQIIGLVYNQLHGTIPTEFGRLQSVCYLYLYGNYFSRTIPTELGNLKNIWYFGLHSNMLTGTIPTELGGLINSTQFTLGYNSLHGTIPSELSALKVVQNFEVQYNYLTGTLPPELGMMARVFNFVVENNFLHGTIPESIIVNIMGSIALSSNLFTGEIPLRVSELKVLESLDVGYNYMHGTLPTKFASRVLKSLSVNSNFFSGTIPKVLNTLQLFQSLNASDNLLEGNLTELFPPTSDQYRSEFPRLKSISLSSNELTGPLPAELFKSSKLNTVVLYSNCLTGSLSPSICVASNLSTLILDSINAAPCCAINFPKALRYFFKGFFGGGKFGGSIPACMWNMPSLVTLHLSGNGLTGTLGDITDESKVKDVTIASNNIVGTLPLSFQKQGRFAQLDLSFNRISGTLASEFNCSWSNQVLDLTVNRLSGRIPKDLMTMQSLNVLNGNLFQCREKDKPEYDPTSEQYVCGSNDLDIALCLWFSVFAVLMVVIAFMRSRMIKVLDVFGLTLVAELSYFYRHILTPSLQFTARFVEITRLFYIYTVGIVVVFLVIALLAFLLLKLVPNFSSLFSTHAEQYTWVTTSAYLHGCAPTAIILFCLYISIFGFRLFLKPVTNIAQAHVAGPGIPLASSTSTAEKKIENEQILRDQNSRSSGDDLCLVFFKISLSVGIQLINVIVTMVVNVAYVYAIFQGLSFWSLSVVQLLLGIYKIVWVNGVMSMLIRRLNFLTHSQQLQHRTFMSLFTFIAGPFLATFFSDSTCFRYLVTGNPEILSSFGVDLFACVVNCVTYLGCATLCSFTSQNYATVDTVVVPGWLYSYQCFSALLSNYIPVLIISYMFSGVIVPASLLAYLHLPVQVVERILPRFIREVVLVDTIHMHVHGDERDMQMYLDRVSTVRLTEGNPGSRYVRPLFNSNIVVTKLLLNLTMLVTFGLAGPLFAVVVCIDSLSVTMLWRILIGRYMIMWNGEPSKMNADCNEEAYLRLERATRQSGEGVGIALYMVVIFIGMFWSLGVFDMIGDVYGPLVGGLVTIVTWLGLPLAYHVLGISSRKSIKDNNRGSSAELSSEGIFPNQSILQYSDDWATRTSFSFASISRWNSRMLSLTGTSGVAPHTVNPLTTADGPVVSGRSVASTPPVSLPLRANVGMMNNDMCTEEGL